LSFRPHIFPPIHQASSIARIAFTGRRRTLPDCKRDNAMNKRKASNATPSSSEGATKKIKLLVCIPSSLIFRTNRIYTRMSALRFCGCAHRAAQEVRFSCVGGGCGVGMKGGWKARDGFLSVEHGRAWDFEPNLHLRHPSADPPLLPFTANAVNAPPPPGTACKSNQLT